MMTESFISGAYAATTMPNIVYVATSLDGYIADESGGTSWLAPFEDADYGFEEFYARVDHMFMGRATYDQVMDIGPWPYEGKPVTVLTHRPLLNPPEGVRVFSGLTRDCLKPSHEGGAESLPHQTGWIIGGSDLVASAIRAGCIDEFDIFVMPLTLGTGVPLFVDGLPALTLDPLSTERFDNGVTRLRYKVTEPDVADDA